MLAFASGFAIETGRPDEWRCNTCGELALRDLDGSWAYLSPVRGDEQWPKQSHQCKAREW